MSVFKSSLSLGALLGGAALALTIGLSAPASAQLAPVDAFASARDANLLPIVDVQARRHVRPQPRRVVRRGPGRGTVAAGALVGAAIIGGALIANSHAAPRPGLYRENNYYVDEYGRRVDAYGRPIDKYGRLIRTAAPVYRPAPQPQYYYEPEPQYYYQPQPRPRPRVHYVPQVERPIVERVRPRERVYEPRVVRPVDPYGREYRRAPAGTSADFGHQYR